MNEIGHQRSALQSFTDLIKFDFHGAFCGHSIQAECAQFISGEDRRTNPRMYAEIEKFAEIGWRVERAYQYNFKSFAKCHDRIAAPDLAPVCAHLRSGADLEQRTKDIMASLGTKQCGRGHVVINASMPRGENVFSLLSEEIVARILLAVLRSNLELGDPHTMLRPDAQCESRVAQRRSADPNRRPMIFSAGDYPHWIFGCQTSESYHSMHDADGFVWLHRAIRPLCRRLREAVDIIGQMPSLLEMPCAVALNGSVHPPGCLSDFRGVDPAVNLFSYFG